MQRDPQGVSPDIQTIKKSSSLVHPITKRLPKEVWIGWISSLVEAYNIAIYSFLAPLLAQLIFQEITSWNAIFFSYSLLFMGSCFFYPLGAFYYGFMGDKQGRQKTCRYSTLGLAVVTGMMGLIPIHFLANTAWIYFLIFICAQYFFSAGEYHGSIIFTLEHAEQKKGGFMSAVSCLFAVFGLVAANGFATFSSFTESELSIRFCFLAGTLGGLISYLLKKHCQETPAFVGLSQKALEGGGWWIFLKSEWQKIGIVMVIFAFFIVSYTFIFIFLPLVDFDQTTHHNFDTFKALMAYGLLLVAAGLLADRFGIQEVMLAGIFLFSMTIIPLCYFCKKLLILQLVLTTYASLVIAPIHSWMMHQFEVQNRCRGIFISAAIATSFFGGSTVPICLLIFEKFHSLAICSLYPLGIALCALSGLIGFYKKCYKKL